jgi:hypothetical protein
VISSGEDIVFSAVLEHKVLIHVIRKDTHRERIDSGGVMLQYIQ